MLATEGAGWQEGRMWVVLGRAAAHLGGSSFTKPSLVMNGVASASIAASRTSMHACTRGFQKGCLEWLGGGREGWLTKRNEHIADGSHGCRRRAIWLRMWSVGGPRRSKGWRRVWCGERAIPSHLPAARCPCSRT